MRESLFNGWAPLLHTLVIALTAYPAMLLMVRVAGHRTLSKLSAFDMIVTIALGSTLASAITSRGVALAQGLLAFGLLVGMQVIVAWLARRSDRLEAWVIGDPILLFHKGRYLDGAMRRAQCTKGEILSVMRSQGLRDESQVESVVLESNGQLSVVEKPDRGAGRAVAGASTLRSVPRADDALEGALPQ